MLLLSLFRNQSSDPNHVNNSFYLPLIHATEIHNNSDRNILGGTSCMRKVASLPAEAK